METPALCTNVCSLKESPQAAFAAFTSSGPTVGEPLRPKQTDQNTLVDEIELFRNDTDTSAFTIEALAPFRRSATFWITSSPLALDEGET